MKQTIAKQSAAMTEASKDPWRCGPCRRLVKAAISYCPNCGGHWTEIADETYVHGQPKKPTTRGWEWDQWSDWNGAQNRTASSRVRSQSQRARRGRKGKGKDKSVDREVDGGVPSFPSMPQSPFVTSGPYAVATTSPPWTVEKPPDQPSVNQELIQAVRKAFPDPSGLPSELKDILDKTESSEMKKITTDLHKSTAALGRARKQLQELQEAKAQHRAKWVQHLNASLDAWQKQTEGFDKQQVQYSTMIQQATIELHAARNSIQQLNAKAAQDRNLESLLEEAPAEHPDAALVDAEEKKLRERMKDVLSKAAKAALPATEVVDLVGSGSPVQVQKRPRSTEPAGGTDTAMQGGGT